MKSYTRVILGALLVIVIALTWTACSSDGYYPGSSTVYVSHGYGGGYGGYGGRGYYGPGW